MSQCIQFVLTSQKFVRSNNIALFTEFRKCNLACLSCLAVLSEALYTDQNYREKLCGKLDSLDNLTAV